MSALASDRLDVGMDAGTAGGIVSGNAENIGTGHSGRAGKNGNAVHGQIDPESRLCTSIVHAGPKARDCVIFPSECRNNSISPCFQMGTALAQNFVAKARIQSLWASETTTPHLTHKVIHSNCGQKRILVCFHLVVGTT